MLEKGANIVTKVCISFATLIMIQSYIPYYFFYNIESHLFIDKFFFMIASQHDSS